MAVTNQKDSSLWKIAINMVTNILCNAAKLSIIMPLIGMKISNYVKAFGSIMLLYLIQLSNQVYLNNENPSHSNSMNRSYLRAKATSTPN